MTSDPEPDVDTTTPVLGVVPALQPPATAAAAVRDAAKWVDEELVRLRAQRTERDRNGLAEIERLRRQLIEDRDNVNAQIKALVTEQARLARVLRVLDQ